MDTENLKVAVADDDSTERYEVGEMLKVLGHQVIAEARNGQQLAQEVARTKPDLVVADMEMPGADSLNGSPELANADPIPVVLTTRRHSPHKLQQWLSRKNVLGYLVKPFAAAALDGTIRFAIGLFRRLLGLEQRLAVLQRSKEDRQIIEDAKSILMKRLGITEAEAHRRLQKMASAANKKLVALCRTLIDDSEGHEAHT